MNFFFNSKDFMIVTPICAVAFGSNSLDRAEMLSLLAPSTKAQFFGNTSTPLQALSLPLRKAPRSGLSRAFLLQSQGSPQQLTAAPQHRAANTRQLYMGSSSADWSGR